jgi:hypothetical protein
MSSVVSLITAVPARNRILVRLLVAGVAIVAAIAGLRRCIALVGKNAPSYLRAHGSVVQILFTHSRTLVRNELSELFASDDNGLSWRALPGGPQAMSIANGGEMWGANGWAGQHEPPSASVSYSSDRGDSWSKIALNLPDGWGDELYARLPAAFINEPDAAPLLLMSDFHLARPELAADSTKWKTVGRRVLGAASVRGTVDRAAGLQHGHSIYIATSGSIYFSGDDGESWSRQEVHRFSDAQVRCRATTCYALLSQSGSEWSGLMTTEVGTNNWKLLRTFDVPQLASALTADGRHASVALFGATALLVTKDRVFVAAIVDAGGEPWGAVLAVAPDGAIATVGHGVPKGLWVLEEAPDGAVWAGGEGAYRLQGDEWIPIWSAPKP